MVSGPFSNTTKGTAERTNALAMQYGVAASRPAATYENMVYFATDTLVLSQVRSAAWVTIGTVYTDGSVDHDTALSNVSADDHHNEDHESRHHRGGTDEIDGDVLDIDMTPSYYTPDTTPGQVTNADELSAHLKGIDNELGRFSVGDLLLASGDTEKNGVGTTPTYASSKDILVNKGGVIRVKFSLKSDSGTIYGRIYVNGSPVGTQRSTASPSWTEYSEDITIEPEDNVQIYTHDNGTCFIKNFRIYVLALETTTLVLD